jgi:hypothetical protein
MSLTVNAKTYANDVSRGPDSYRYNGPAHSFDSPDVADLWRKSPIKTATSNGKGRAIFKITRGCTDGSTYVGDAILKVETSLPADAATAELQAVIDDVAAWLATSAADDLLINQKINQ